MKIIVLFLLILCVYSSYGQNKNKSQPMKLEKHFIQSIPNFKRNGVVQNKIINMNLNSPISLKMSPNVMNTTKTLQDPQLLTNEITEIGVIDGPGNLESGLVPPDPCGDVGYNYYMQANNNYFVIYNKSGTVTTEPTFFSDFWDVGFFLSDPVVIFDEIDNRWIMCEIGIDTEHPVNPECWFLLAMSQTDNPNLNWDIWSFNTGDKIFDYPKLGNSENGVFFSANIYSVFYVSKNKIDSKVIGTAGGAFNKEQMLAGNNLVDYDKVTVNYELGSPWSLLPLDIDGIYPANMQNTYFAWISDDDNKGYDYDRLYLIPASFNGSTFSLYINESISFDVDNFTSYAGTSFNYSCTVSGIDVISDRLLYRLQGTMLNGDLAIVATHNILAPTTDNIKAMRWYELLLNSDGFFLSQQGTFSLLGDGIQPRDRWMGSIAINYQGEIAMGYNVVRKHVPNNNKKWIAIGITGREYNDPQNQMTYQEILYKNETCYDPSPYPNDPHKPIRWGDYTMMSVDPSDGSTFWYTSELPTLPSGTDWTTKTISFKLNPCINNLSLQNITINKGNSSNYNAYSSIQAAGKNNSGLDTYFLILDGGSAVFTAGEIIKLKPGFHSFFGSAFHVYNQACFNKSNPKLKTGEPKSMLSEKKGKSEKQFINLIPNPTNGMITIDFDKEASGIVKIISINGNLVFSQNLYEKNSFIIDLTSIPKGIYLFKFYSNNYNYNYQDKIIVY